VILIFFYWIDLEWWFKISKNYAHGLYIYICVSSGKSKSLTVSHRVISWGYWQKHLI
jgi:hypothetical protein